MIRANEYSADLRGTKVLVVEDEFYLAIELKEAFKRAGCEVLGPCPHVEAALAELGRTVPDCAVVDINLGFGPSFELAEVLLGQDVPFLFLTGYDAPSIPARFARIERVEKPVEVSKVLAVAGRLAGAKTAQQ